MFIPNAFEPLVQKTLAQLRKLGINEATQPPKIHTSYYGSFRPEERDFFTEIVSRISLSHLYCIIFEKGQVKPRLLDKHTLIIPHSLEIDEEVEVRVRGVIPRREYRVSFTLLEDYVTINGEKFYVIEGGLYFYQFGINDISKIKGLENLTNLQWLQLQENRIEEIKGLDNLVNLKSLILSDNRIREIKGLESLTNLISLYLERNLIEEIKGLDNLTELRELRLSNNRISELKGLDYLPNLEKLCLAGNEIKEIKGVNNLIALKTLYLNDNKIGEMKGLDNLVNLEDLYLHNDSYVGNTIEVIKGLGKLKELRFLNLNHNPVVTATETEELEQLTNLKIYLLSTPLGGSYPSWTEKELWRYFLFSAKNVAALARGDVTLKEIGGWWEDRG